MWPWRLATSISEKKEHPNDFLNKSLFVVWTFCFYFWLISFDQNYSEKIRFWRNLSEAFFFYFCIKITFVLKVDFLSNQKMAWPLKDCISIICCQFMRLCTTKSERREKCNKVKIIPQQITSKSGFFWEKCWSNEMSQKVQTTNDDFFGTRANLNVLQKQKFRLLFFVRRSVCTQKEGKILNRKAF